MLFGLGIGFCLGSKKEMLFNFLGEDICKYMLIALIQRLWLLILKCTFLFYFIFYEHFKSALVFIFLYYSYIWCRRLELPLYCLYWGGDIFSKRLELKWPDHFQKRLPSNYIESETSLTILYVTCKCKNQHAWVAS